MSKREYLVETHRPFKVSHQLLCITKIDFKTKSLVGFTELQIVSQVDSLPVIRLNCQQCRIYTIYIDEYPCNFTYSDPRQDILATSSSSSSSSTTTTTTNASSTTDQQTKSAGGVGGKGPRKLDTFSNTHYEVIKTTDCDVGNGELVIEVPDFHDLKTAVLEHRPLKLCIAYLVENPTGGLYFAVNNQSNQFGAGDQQQQQQSSATTSAGGANDKEGGPSSSTTTSSLEDDGFSPHMFSTGRSNNSRLWFPCVDSFSESCTWSIQITVDEAYTAIASGELAEVEHIVEKRLKRFTYSLQVPTSAPNIGLVVGPFVPVVHPHMHEVVSFAFPTLKSLLPDTTEQTHKIFMHYEELLNTRYPYATYKQVFVDNLVSKYEAYATLSLINISQLHSKAVIEQTYISRRVLAQAIAEQYFGAFISMQTTADAWLTRGISGYLAYDYIRKAFGNNEYRIYVKRAMDKVIKYEQLFRPVVLDPSRPAYTEQDYFAVKNFHTYSPVYEKMHRVKAFLALRMLEIYLGKTLLLQVLHKMLSLATLAAPTRFALNNNWYHLHTSTASFIWAISTVTGKNIDTFLKQWVFQGGHVKFTGSFVFNRKRNTVELEIKQTHVAYTGVRRYLGPLMIWLQELDGTFKHTLQIEDNLSKHDITCHSKSRRNKKKKIPLCTGEEIDMDLSGMDMDSPVLWLRIDPEMTLLREVILEQPDYQWTYQLRYERDVIAQMESLAVLDRFSTKQAREALLEVIASETTFYRVRCQATYCLRRVANLMGASWLGPPALLPQFRKLFGSPSCPNIVRMNNFSHFQHYFLQMDIIKAVAGLRTLHGICPPEVLRFLFDLFKYNDNSKNAYTDAYYRAALVDALAETVTPVAIAPIFNVAGVGGGGGGGGGGGVGGSTTTSGGAPFVVDMLSTDTKSILEEITRSFNLDKLLPCYRNVVTVSCLRAIRLLQRMGHLPSSGAIFRAHTSHNCFVEVRKAAIEILVDIVRAEGRKEDLDFLLDDLVVGDPQPVIKFYTLKYLIKNPPFTFLSEEQCPLDTEELVEKLWALMNGGTFATDSRLRCAVVDLYYVLYGRGRPRCLPKPEFSFILNIAKEKKPPPPLQTAVTTGDPANGLLNVDVKVVDHEGVTPAPFSALLSPSFDQKDGDRLAASSSSATEAFKDKEEAVTGDAHGVVVPSKSIKIAAVAATNPSPPPSLVKEERFSSFERAMSTTAATAATATTSAAATTSSSTRPLSPFSFSTSTPSFSAHFSEQNRSCSPPPPLRLFVGSETKAPSVVASTATAAAGRKRSVAREEVKHNDDDDDDMDSSPDSESEEEGQIKKHHQQQQHSHYPLHSVLAFYSPPQQHQEQDSAPAVGGGGGSFPPTTTGLTLTIKKSSESGQLGSEYASSRSAAGGGGGGLQALPVPPFSSSPVKKKKKKSEERERMVAVGGGSGLGVCLGGGDGSLSSSSTTTTTTGKHKDKKHHKEKKKKKEKKKHKEHKSKHKHKHKEHSGAAAGEPPAEGGGGGGPAFGV